MHKMTPKPIKRGLLRLKLGQIYFSSKRWLYWVFGDIKFAHRRAEDLLYEHFTHATPLLRNLKDVDMELQYNKITNLKIAVPKVHMVTIYPGEVFSYWRLIGVPTIRKGYLKGMVLKNGTFSPGVGGGLCQLSNLIYWLSLHTPLTVIERHRHGYDVFPDSDRTQPFGSGATCFYNYGDLMIRNNTNQGFQLVLEITDTHLKGAWMSDVPPSRIYDVYEKEHIIKPEFWGGYTRHNTIFRKVFDLDNILLDDEFVVENHAIMMYEPLLSDGKI
ncbi:MAG: VanW family protein [Defluviitaleaceae bacterium]|nr:VanW family protein [Defluviitaleaceae bacterium]